jgi:hypothetical protein
MMQSVMLKTKPGASPEFTALCKTLYGDVIDADQVWDAVHKLAPDQADLHAPSGASFRNRAERASNGVGMAAGGLGLAAALRDDRLTDPAAPKYARKIGAVGEKMPKVMDRVKSKKVRAALGAGAVLTQVANLGGDAAISGTLGAEGQRQSANKTRRVRHKGTLTETSVDKGVKDLFAGAVSGLRRHWDTAAGTLEETGSKAIPMGSKPGPPAGKELVHVPRGSLKPNTVAMTTPKPVKAKKPAAGAASAEAAAKVPDSPGGKPFWEKVGFRATDAVNTPTGRAGLAMGAVGGVGADRQAQNRGARREREQYAMGKRANPTTDVTWEGTFAKFDLDKHQAFGWASVTKINGQNVIDKQDDWIPLEEIEDAAYTYVVGSRVGGDMHRRDPGTGQFIGKTDAPHKVSDMIESMVFTPDKISKMGLPADFTQGWWVGFKIHDEPTWELVKKGERTGFSVHGKGRRVPIAEDEAMGYR